MCALPGTNTTAPGGAGPPSTAEEAACALAHGEQAALAGHGMMVPSVPQLWLEKSSRRLHCKTMRGQILGCSWDKQLLLQLPQTFTAKPVPGAAPFAALIFTSYAGEELAAGTVAAWGLSVYFPLFFLHIVSQQLAQRTLGTSSTCCGAELPCPCCTQTDETTSPAHQAKAALTGPPQRPQRQPKKEAVPRKTAQLHAPSFSPEP